MPFDDDRGLPLTTRSQSARAAYCAGVARMLAAQPGIEASL